MLNLLTRSFDDRSADLRGRKQMPYEVQDKPITRGSPSRSIK